MTGRGYNIGTVDVPGRAVRILTGEARPGSVVPHLFTRLSWSPDGGRIAFAGVGVDTDRAGDRTDIYTVRHDGARRRRLTRLGDALNPIWSPDGRSIIFTRLRPVASSENATPAGALWAMSTSGGHLRRVTRSIDGQIDVAGSFTPDGSVLLLSRATCEESSDGGCSERTSTVLAVRPDGSDERNLVSRAADPAVSPDGRHLAFVSDRDENGTLNYGDREFPANELYVSNRDGTNARRLTRSRARNETSPSWLPDGRRLAFQRGVAFDNAEAMSIFQVNRDGSCERSVLASSPPGPWYASPAWRPGKSRRAAGRLAC